MVKKISDKVELVNKPVEVKTGVVLELTNEEANYIYTRLQCSSFKTYDAFRQENKLPHPSRAKMFAAFAAAYTPGK